IKVEEPGSGDGTRAWGPPWVGDESAYFFSANRNKRSITVDLKTDAGRALVCELAARADVVIENFKVGGAAKLGLDYATLAALNPRLVYCSITGYGQTGPYRERAGYDFIIQAQGGIMSITGPEEGEPYKVGVAIADITAGLFATTAILAALHERERSGRGQYIDVALLDAQVAWLANVAHNYLATGEPPARYGNAHPSIVPYETFATADGRIAVGMGTDGQYRKFCVAAG
ncbi:MAG: CoA transferase, partial [Anaerolineales bacterium]|nr:CoA transferase [Anaerolineales bacterium]